MIVTNKAVTFENLSIKLIKLSSNESPPSGDV